MSTKYWRYECFILFLPQPLTYIWVYAGVAFFFIFLLCTIDRNRRKKLYLNEPFRKFRSFWKVFFIPFFSSWSAFLYYFTHSMGFNYKGWKRGKEWNSTRYSTDTNDLIINTAVGWISYFFFMFIKGFNYFISRDLLANIS